MVAQSPTSISSGGRKQHPVAEKSQKKPQKKIWVVKLQRIPFGFFEKELLGYFRQFGNVLRIRVARSRKTGNHKGWAYVGFDNKSVAEIAAESMNGYLMFEQRLGCKVMKPSLIPKSMLKGPLLVMRPSYMGLAKRDSIARHNSNGKNDGANARKRAKNIKKAMMELQNMGISYDFSLSRRQKAPLNKVSIDNDVEVIRTAKSLTPKTARLSPKVVVSSSSTPKASTPKIVSSQKSFKTDSPVTTKKVVIKTPQTEKVKMVEKTPKFSPKTRAAKAAALGTPQPKSTLSKTILKSVAASARPAAVEKKVVKSRGKKKSL